MKRKIIVVIGAKSKQNKGLIDKIVADRSGQWGVRVLTRAPDSVEAVELRKRGVQVIYGDLDSPASIDSGCIGAYGAFFVTFYWAHLSTDTEKKHAKVMANAAVSAKLKHVIWSTLEDTRRLVPLNDDRMPTLQGRYKVPHFDNKAEIDELFLDIVQHGPKVTFLRASFYFENFESFFKPSKEADGTYTITLPMESKRLSMIGADGIGGSAFGIFESGSEVYGGRTIGIAAQFSTMDEIVRKMSARLSVTINYRDIEPDAYRAFGFPGADDIGNMFQVYRDFESEILAARNLAESHELDRELQSFEQWLMTKKPSDFGIVETSDVGESSETTASVGETNKAETVEA